MACADFERNHDNIFLKMREKTRETTLAFIKTIKDNNCSTENAHSSTSFENFSLLVCKVYFFSIIIQLSKNGNSTKPII